MAATLPREPRRYFGYGLIIDSVLPLPELVEISPEECAGPADVTVDLGSIADNGLPAGDTQTLNWLAPQRLWFHLEGIAQFLIEHGRSIRIQPDPGCDEASLRVYLLGSGFGGLLFQRDLLVLHGNSVRIGDACLVSVGESGAGKSTLAAGFLARGLDVLADDVVPVDAYGCAVSGFPRIKLWGETARRLGIETAGLQQILPVLDKYNVPLPRYQAGLRLPVSNIYVLEVSPDPGIRLEPVSGMERIRVLTDHTYRFHFLQEPEQLAAHLRQCSRLAGQARMVRVTRSSEGFELDALLDLIVADARANPG